MAEIIMGAETIDELKEVVLNEIRGRGGEYDVDIRKHVKENGTFTGVCLKPKNSTIGPTLYLEYLQDAIRDGLDEDVAVKQFVDTLEKSLVKDEDIKLDLKFIYDFEQVKNKLSFLVVNCKKNPELLNVMVYTNTVYDDLIMIPIIKFNSPETGDGVIKITKELAAKWNVDEQDILQAAMDKAPVNDPFEVMDFPVIPGFEVYAPPFEIITTKGNVKGSRVLLYSEFSQYMKDNYPDGVYIIPASVHEVFLMESQGSWCDEEDMRRILDIINVANSDTLTEADYLSDKLYAYKDGEIRTYDRESLSDN